MLSHASEDFRTIPHNFGEQWHSKMFEKSSLSKQNRRNLFKYIVFKGEMMYNNLYMTVFLRDR